MINVILSTSVNVSSEELSIWAAIFGIPFALAFGFYVLVYRYYRNTDKNYNYEKETVVQISGLKTSDVKIGDNNGTKERYIRGRNSDDHRTRVRRIALDVAPPALNTPVAPNSPEVINPIPDVIPPNKTN